MTECVRCGEQIASRLTDRFQLRAYDFTESSVAFHEGQLCPSCWNQFTEFMAEPQVVAP